MWERGWAEGSELGFLWIAHSGLGNSWGGCVFPSFLQAEEEQACPVPQEEEEEVRVLTLPLQAHHAMEKMEEFVYKVLSWKGAGRLTWAPPMWQACTGGKSFHSCAWAWFSLQGSKSRGIWLNFYCLLCWRCSKYILKQEFLTIFAISPFGSHQNIRM